MDTEQLDSILSFKLSNFGLAFLGVIILNFNFLLNLIIFAHSLRRDTLINKFLDFVVHVERLNNFLVIPIVDGFNFVN